MRWPPKLPRDGLRAVQQVTAIAEGKLAGYRLRALLAEAELREAERIGRADGLIVAAGAIERQVEMGMPLIFGGAMAQTLRAFAAQIKRGDL